MQLIYKITISNLQFSQNGHVISVANKPPLNNGYVGSSRSYQPIERCAHSPRNFYAPCALLLVTQPVAASDQNNCVNYSLFNEAQPRHTIQISNPTGTDRIIIHLLHPSQTRRRYSF